MATTVTDDVLPVVWDLCYRIAEQLNVAQVWKFGELADFPQRRDLVAMQVKRLHPWELQEVNVDLGQLVERYIQPLYPFV